MLLEAEQLENSLGIFDETLKSLRRQFRKILKEAKAHRNCKLLNLSGDSSTTSTKTNESSKLSQDAKESISEEKNVLVDISITENIDAIEKLVPNDLGVSKIVENNLQLDQVPEILSVQFDTESEQSLFKQLEQSKLNSKNKEIQIQKSPVFSRSKPRGKKNFSCKIFPDVEKKNKSITKQVGIEKSTQDNVSLNTSLFSSIKEKDTVTSPKSKHGKKLMVSSLYNVNSKLSNKGNKLKQTKLVLVTEEEKTDISQETHLNVKVETGAFDSFCNSSLFNSNINAENMEIDMDDTRLNSSINVPCAQKASTNRTENVFEQISPVKENKSRILAQNKIQVKNNLFGMDWKANEPKATSTQFLSPEKNVQYSDSDTNFSFHQDLLLKKPSTSSPKKKLVGFIKKASVLKENSHKDYHQVNKAHGNETMIDDETFFSPGELANNEFKTPTKPGNSREAFTSPLIKRLPMRNLDGIKGKKKHSPEHAYIETVRGKQERAKLDGWACWECKKYYQDLNLPEEELKKCLKACSRHKAKYDPNYYTPPGFWNPCFPDTVCPSFPQTRK